MTAAQLYSATDPRVARTIDGRSLARALGVETARQAADLHARTGVLPTLAVVLVGEDPASQVYVRRKVKETKAAGMRSIEHRLEP